VLDPARIAPALDQIDPQSRALIELFYRRGLAEQDIEDLLGIGPGGLAARRTAAEIEFAGELGVGLGELHAELPELTEEAWTGDFAPATDEFEPHPDDDLEPLPDADWAPPPGGEMDPPDGSSGLGHWIAALVAALAIAAIVLVVIVANADNGSNNTSRTTSSPAKTTATDSAGTKTTPATPGAGPVVTLQRLNGTNGKGTAQLTGLPSQPKVHLKVRDFLEPQGGGYAVWLYNSPDDAKLLHSTTQPDLDVTLPLPTGYRNYRFVDVSREADANPGHMGLSLLRTAFADLEPK
jgi:hypothetical protein